MKKNFSILIVEDDYTTAYINRTLIKEANISSEVFLADNGKEALDFLKGRGGDDNYVDLILLDLNMPVLNGFDFLEEYQKSSFFYPKTKIVVLTTSSNRRDYEKAKSFLVFDYLEKPLSVNRLKGILGV